MFLVYLEMYKDEKKERSVLGDGKEGGWFKFLCKYGNLNAFLWEWDTDDWDHECGYEWNWIRGGISWWTVIYAILTYTWQLPPLICESIVNPKKLILQSFRVKSLGSNARFKNLWVLHTMSCINMQIICTQKAQKVDSIDHKKFLRVSFLFLGF